MLTGMMDKNWEIAVEVFRAVCFKRGKPGHDDRKFLETLHYFTVCNNTWRDLPAQVGRWNNAWKRLWRLSQTGTFEASFETLVSLSEAAYLVQMFDSTVVRAQVSAAGAKGSRIRISS